MSSYACKCKLHNWRLKKYCLPHLLIKKTQQHFRSLTVENLIITDLWVSREELGGTHKSSPGCSVVKNPPANSGNSREVGLIPESTKIPWSRKRQPTPVFSLENSMGWGVHGATKSQTRLSTHTIQYMWKEVSYLGHQNFNEKIVANFNNFPLIIHHLINLIQDIISPPHHTHSQSLTHPLALLLLWW